MAIIKSYTDLEQSRKLAEILSLDSADMSWCNNSIRGVNYTDSFSANLHTVKEMRKVFDEALRGWDKYWELIPCWSLAALLGVLPEGIIENYYVPNLQKENGKYSIAYGNDELLCMADNPIDVCVTMIEKLHEEKLL